MQSVVATRPDAYTKKEQGGTVAIAEKGSNFVPANFPFRLQSAKHINSRVLRWSLLLQEYSFTVEYIKGTDNVGADYMSRV